MNIEYKEDIGMVFIYHEGKSVTIFIDSNRVYVRGFEVIKRED